MVFNVFKIKSYLSFIFLSEASLTINKKSDPFINSKVDLKDSLVQLGEKK